MQAAHAHLTCLHVSLQLASCCVLLPAPGWRSLVEGVVTLLLLSPRETRYWLCSSDLQQRGGFCKHQFAVIVYWLMSQSRLPRSFTFHQHLCSLVLVSRKLHADAQPICRFNGCKMLFLCI